MRICVVGPFNPKSVSDYFGKDIVLPNINITASSVNTYVRALLELGNEVTVITTDPNSERIKKYVGCKIKIITIHNKFIIRGFTRFLIYKRIRMVVGKLLDNIDILHSEWTYEYTFAVLPFVKRKPTFCSVRDWCPYIISIVKGFKQKLTWYLSFYMFKKVMNENKLLFIANSDYTYNNITCNYPDNKVIIIPNPIQREYILDSRKDYPTNHIFVAVSQSLQNIRKNYKVLLVAFKKYIKFKPFAKLILIGSYTDKWKSEMEKEKLLKNVELKESMNHEDIFKVFDNSSCLIHPSLEETFGNIFLEAMARRLPCIGGKNSGAVPQILGNGNYGILCDVTNPDSIIEAMMKIDDRDFINSLVNKSSEYLINNYLDRVIAQKHLYLFSDSLENMGK